MLIAQQLQYNNRSEYLLYMWQVEDILRAHHCNLDELRQNYLSRFEVTDEQRAQLEQWYENLCTMMREEGVTERGHLQINKNVVEGLAEIHELLVDNAKYPYYRQMYYKVLPYIVELRSKQTAAQKEQTLGVAQELELCFELLYGVMLLRLQKKEVSAETLAAAKDISTFLGQLSDYWKANREGKLDTTATTAE